MKFIKIICAGLAVLAFSACGGGGGGGTNTQASVQPISTPTPVTSVKLSGMITYDHIPHKTSGFGLNYNAITARPARGIVVVLLDENGTMIDETVADDQGGYSFNVAVNKDVKVQAKAQLGNVTITDNTFGNGLYVMEGSLMSSGDKAFQSRDLHARSGWESGRYNAPRVAGPFAILDPVYDAIEQVKSVDASVNMPPLEIRWSPKNVPMLGDKSAGNIGTSGFHWNENAIYLLGAEGRDTDEYDPHVIIHEWGHYFEHNLSRRDSMGGLHSLGDKLDPRLAFSEGWGNALAAIITGDPDYKDSSGEGQDAGFVIDFENMKPVRSGWYNEGSIAAILYDIHDTAMDGNDRMALGFEPIYRAVTDGRFKNTEVFTTVFTFSENFLRQPGVNKSDYELLLSGQSILSSDAMAGGEKNSGAIASALPVYKDVQLGGPAVQICSVDDAGNFNKLGNREFVFVKLEADGNYVLTMTRISGDEQRDPDFNIWQGTTLVKEVSSSLRDIEMFQGALKAGSYVIDAYDFYNINGASSKRGDACYSFSISQE